MKSLIKTGIISITTLMTLTYVCAQQVEVQGELKVSQMNTDENGKTLVVKNSDGTLGTRSVASLPFSQPPIDTMRNLASDFELAKHLCDCPNPPPFMIKKLLESGYTQEELVGAGVNVQDVIDAQRMGILIDTRDNKSYKTVTIGTQTWMAENLNFGTQVNGAGEQTENNIIEKYCYNNSSVNCETYGGLYQWNEMMGYITTEGTQGVCPTGWHIPTDDEWKILEMQLGMTQVQVDSTNFRGTDQGSQLAGSEQLWTDGLLDQNGVFGSSGFLTLPAGHRYPPLFTVFDGQSIFAKFWSSSGSDVAAWSRILAYDLPSVARTSSNTTHGYSVRCVKD